MKVTTGSQIPVPTEAKQEKQMTAREPTGHCNEIAQKSPTQNSDQMAQHGLRATDTSRISTRPKVSQKKDEAFAQNNIVGHNTKSDHVGLPEHEKDTITSGQRRGGSGGRRGRAPWFRGRRGRGNYRGGSPSRQAA